MIPTVLPARDYYAVLGVDRRAGSAAIRAAYRARARVVHPDRGGDEAEMMLVNEAWKVLRDRASRARYDESLAAPPPPPPKRADGRTVVDFGRYQGWTIPAIAEVDDDYLVWLMRTPAGRPLQAEITRILHERQRALDALQPSRHSR